MAPTIFTRAIGEGRSLQLFNEGKNLRDFTYIDDIVDGVVKVLLYPVAGHSRPPAATAATRAAGLASALASGSTPPSLRIFNLGHHRPVETLLFVRMLEELLGKKAAVELLPPQPGDMFETCADLTRIQAEVGFAPKVPLEEGLRRFVDWFREYYGPGNM
jgi:UDP-glucuronate 4-epimerase